MINSFLTEHSGPYLIFGDSVYPATSSQQENFVARRTISGHESTLGFLQPIPIRDLEKNLLFTKRTEVESELDNAILAYTPSVPMDPLRYKNRLAAIEFILKVIPFLATRDNGPIDNETIQREVLGDDVSPTLLDRARAEEFVESLAEQEIDPFYSGFKPVEQAIEKLAFPQGLDLNQTSVLNQTLLGNAFYVDNGNAHLLKTSQSKTGDRIHIQGKNFYWTRRFDLASIDEVYGKNLLTNLKDRQKDRVELMLESQENMDDTRKLYCHLAELDNFTFRNMHVLWMGERCYLMMKSEPFARQDFEEPTKWHPRDAFEVGISLHYKDDQLVFTETPYIIADYPDVAWYENPLGIFRQMCAQDRSVWKQFDTSPEGAAQYMRAALDRMHNGFPPELIRTHIWHFGDGHNYRELFPLDKALTANSLEEVRKQGYEPRNYYLQLK